MSDSDAGITTAQLEKNVDDYAKLFPEYEVFADALKKVLESACKSAFPEAIVQARPKAVASFAEKCVRKFAKYPNGAQDMTDLCGARVIVQTLDQVEAVRLFIETNFTVDEADEKGLSLGEDKFGYRDMHYIVRLEPQKAEKIGFTPDNIKTIGPKRAEIQVRTWVQHAWADTLHDRMYKTKLKYPGEFKRAGALLAAIMEEGDRAFNRLAGDIDGMLTNFNAYASNDDVKRELDIQKLLLETAKDSKKPGIALQIAKLSSPRGDYARVEAELSGYSNDTSPLGCAIRMELGYALCKLHVEAPRSKPYRDGQELLKRVVEHCRETKPQTVPDLRRRRGVMACALARLAWSYGALDEDASLARTCYREALELEPGNPYYLADVIGHEVSFTRGRDFVGAMASGIHQAIETCLSHIRNGTEMPYAAFTAGRLHLLLGEDDLALGAYARGIRHALEATSCVPPDVLESERKWIILVTKPAPLSGGYRWAKELLQLAERLRNPESKEDSKIPKRLQGPVLIVGGGATSLTPVQADALRPMLCRAFAGLRGTVISGGTNVGVPGCVGEAAALVGPCGKRPFKLVGYLPRIRPDDAPRDTRYDEHIDCGENSFTAEQLIRNWTDILDSGIEPADVRLLGFGGGRISAMEYQIALGFGACVGLVACSGGAADELLKDSLWDNVPKRLGVPCDGASLRALAHGASADFTAETLEGMAKSFHEEFLRTSTNRLPDNMKPWEDLDKTYKQANLEQAKYAVQILQACGFIVRQAEAPKITVEFTQDEIEGMAELEHGRWNVERLCNGWRYGKPRDNARKLHDCIVPWNVLSDGDKGFKKYDRQSVVKFPVILAQAGLEIVRK